MDVEPPTQQIKDAIYNALQDANQCVYNQAQVEKSDMGTTGVVAYIWEGQGKQKAIVGSVGDSRAYIYRRGKVEQITLDDGIVKMVTKDDEQKARVIQARLNNVINPNDPSQLAPEERYLYDKRNLITQAIGTKNIVPNTYVIDLQPGDKLLLASDGVTDNLTDKEIAYAILV